MDFIYSLYVPIGMAVTWFLAFSITTLVLIFFVLSVLFLIGLIVQWYKFKPWKKQVYKKEWLYFIENTDKVKKAIALIYNDEDR